MRKTEVGGGGEKSESRERKEIDQMLSGKKVKVGPQQRKRTSV